MDAQENGALVLTQAFALRDKSQTFFTNAVIPRLISTNSWPPEIRTRVRAYLETNAAALAEIDRALAFRRFRFPVDYTGGFATEVPHLSASKGSAVLLSLRTTLAAEEGAEWSKFLERQIQFGAALNDEPTAIGFMVRCACLQIAINTAERSLLYSRPDIAACQRLSAAFLQVAETNLLPRAFIVERALALPVFRTVPHFPGSSGEDDEGDQPAAETRPRHYKPFFRVTGFFERDMNFYLDSMAAAIALAGEANPANLALTNLFANVETNARSHYYIYTGMFLPALGRVAVRNAIVQANLRMAAVAFAIEGFRQTNGRLPRNLEELIPAFLKEVPVDPFTAQPLRYLPRPEGYRVYSVGPDGVDNGGIPEPKRRRGLNASNYDLTFAVPREEQR